MKKTTLEVLVNHISNKEVAQIENAGTVELRLREDFKEEKIEIQK